MYALSIRYGNNVPILRWTTPLKFPVQLAVTFPHLALEEKEGVMYLFSRYLGRPSFAALATPVQVQARLADCSSLKRK